MSLKSRPNKSLKTIDINIEKPASNLPVLENNLYGVFLNFDEVFSPEFQPELITGNLNKEQLMLLYKYINRLYDEVGFSKEAYDDIILALDIAYKKLPNG